MMRKTITVLIPVYRPGKMVRELLTRLSRQTHVPEKIIIIHTLEESSDRKTEGDPESDKRDADYYMDYLFDLSEEFRDTFGDLTVYHIPKEEFGHGKTRDFGICESDTELCLCMTQDALPRDRKLVTILEQAFEDPEVGAAYGRQLAGKKSNPLEREARLFNYPARSEVKSSADLVRVGIKTFFCSDVCAMWRKDLYEQLGGFEKDVIFNEDMILAGKMIKAGYKIAYCADACVYHSHNYPGARQLRRNFDLGVSQADHPEIFSMASSGKEGIRFVKTAVGNLLHEGHADMIPAFIWQSGCKFAGYQLGKHYRMLPGKVIEKITDSPEYWKKENK